MGGQIDWAALPTVVEILGIRDPEALILDLESIRDHMTENKE